MTEQIFVKKEIDWWDELFGLGVFAVSGLIVAKLTDDAFLGFFGGIVTMFVASIIKAELVE